MNWKSAKEPPEEIGEYLCVVCSAYHGFPEYTRAIVDYEFDGISGRYWKCENMIVTHWMELPKLPKEVF